MAFKLIVLSAIFAYAQAGGLIAAPALSYAAAPALAYGAPLATPAITSQSSNILRSYGNLGQISTYSKTIDTPFSSVRKADIRVSNPGLRFAAAPALAYSAPAIASPVYSGYSAPVLRSAAIAAPAISTYHAPALAAPVLRSAYAAPVVSAPAALGVAYSAAPAVSHINYASAYANYGW